MECKRKNEITFGFLMLIIITIANFATLFYFHLDFFKNFDGFLLCELYGAVPFLLMIYSRSHEENGKQG